MSKTLAYTLGVLSGIYIAQTYQIPKIVSFYKFVKDEIQKYEK
jgi:hypothetical protein